MTVRPPQRVIVVGAGVVGVTTALELGRAGVDVLVLDRAAEPAAAASHANGGLLTPSMADPWNAPGVWWDLLRHLGRADAPMLLRPQALPRLLTWGMRFLAGSRRRDFEAATAANVRLALYSLECLAELRRLYAPDYDANLLGTIKIYRAAAGLARGVAKCRALDRFGLQWRALDADQVLDLEPVLAPIRGELAGGIHFPRDESGDAHLFTVALSHRAEAMGVAFRFGCGVRDLVPSSGRVTAVRVDDGSLMDADAVVVAGGVWSAALAARAGYRTWIRPVKGYSLTLPATPTPPLRRPVIDDDLHAAITPLANRLRLAGTAEFAGFDERVRGERVENLRDILRALLPEQAHALLAADGEPWAGLRPVHARGVPTIGATRIPGLWVNTGHGHLGWTLAAGSARALAQVMTTGRSEFPLQEYRPDDA